VLGAVVRGGLHRRGNGDPVPLIPLVLRRALRHRPGAGLSAWRAAAAGALAMGAAALLVTGWLHIRSVGYVVDRSAGNGETRFSFSDGSRAVVDRSSHLGVLSAQRDAVALRLDDGRARLHLTGAPEARWTITAGPYTLLASTADLDLRWTASQGALSLGITTGSALVKGPLGDHLPVKLAAGQRLVARSGDRSWRLDPDSDVGLAGAGRTHCRERGEAGAPAASDSAAPTVWQDTDGCLVYGRDARGNQLPDFSSAGYRAGAATIPVLPRVAGPVLPGNGGDDTAAIQAALDAAAALPQGPHGYRGAVELGAGTFTLRGSLRLLASGVVLRGQGDATVLSGVGTARSLIVMGPEARPALATTTFHRVLDAYVPVGARTLELDTTADLQVGDDVVVRSAGLTFERRVVALDGKRVTLDVPLTDDLDREHTDAIVVRYRFPERVSDVGVESMAGNAAFDPTSDLGDGIFIQVKAVSNAWVRQVGSENFESGVVSLAESSRFVTIADASYQAPANPGPEGWSRAFTIGGQQNLLLRARAHGARQALHTWSRTPGPNAVVDFVASGGASRLALGRFSSGLLLDGVHVTPDPAAAAAAEDDARARGRERRESNAVVWTRSAGGGRPESLYRAQLAERVGDATAEAVVAVAR
jgi:hypothetical protein